ncbi:MAG TPA: hypothetical protein VNV85_02210 [Puia sp.]|jgi:hypothetical protein|nr:hypothetical protein [Puia sp.]
MTILPPQGKENKILFLIAFLIMLSVAFIQCYKTTHDLHWSLDADFYRDMAYIQGILEGHFGKDPNISGAYLWYNPLLVSIEALIAKISGLPINEVVMQSGTYLNLLAPLAFFIMLSVLFDFKIALASSLSFLFLASGNIPGFDAATYSPWLYPVCFNQFLFYLNIILCYKAFSAQKYFWFILLGASIGINFLGHTAPALIMILIMASIQSQRIFQSLKEKTYALLKKYLMQGVVTFLFFVIASFPLLYFIIGKYHLQFKNRFPFEYVDTIFIWHNIADMIKVNFSVSFIIAVIGFIWFYRNFRQALLRKIILNWLFIAVIMFIYSTIVASADRHFNIHLPGTVPSFHYFYYLKALQSVFFGFGFLFLIRVLYSWIDNFFHRKIKIFANGKYTNEVLILAVLLYAAINLPSYINRFDFVYYREQILIKEKEKDRIDAYHFIVQNIPSDKVILCEAGDPSLFPVMPTGRKMVSIGISYSNPYVDFGSRETDRNNMILFLKTGQPLSAKGLFDAYHVSFVLLSNVEIEKSNGLQQVLGQPIYKNNLYTLFDLKM